MWSVVLGSVRLFPNLEVALKGVFNRVLTKLYLFWKNNLGDAREKAVRDAVKDRSGFELIENDCESIVNMCGSLFWAL